MLRSRQHPISTVYPAGAARRTLSCHFATAKEYNYFNFNASYTHSIQPKGGPFIQSLRRQVETKPSVRSLFFHQASSPHTGAGRLLHLVLTKEMRSRCWSLPIFANPVSQVYILPTAVRGTRLRAAAEGIYSQGRSGCRPHSFVFFKVHRQHSSRSKPEGGPSIHKVYILGCQQTVCASFFPCRGKNTHGP